ncbi:MAG: rhodanese-like domain-containing protein [Campylobacterales bacterium]|nr:rhodanese-like domain-containing protein [Campylobacterales bacterium]
MHELLQKPLINSNELEALLKERAAGNVDFLLVDVREQMEYDRGHIKGVDMLKPTSMFQSWASNFLETYKDKTVILTCRTDNRSGQVQMILKHNGMKNVINHSGGIVSYRGEVVRG